MSAVARRDHATTGQGYPNNLPRYLTGFVGRLRDLKALRSLLATSPLLTLTGPGGSGKTRLAVQLLGSSKRRWPDGIWWVDLAPIDDPGLVPSAVAAALGLPRLSSMAAAVSSWLASRNALLLLDTCEHVLPGCAEMCDRLIQRCPDITIIATSREPLGIVGEAVWPVASLPESEAALLFEQRARLGDIEFKLGAANKGVVSEICERLDGMPLAIELAAARLGMMSEREILNRLADRFQLLTRSAQTLHRRQQTMAGTIDWSYKLLTDDEARLFRRLSVFRGGFSLEAAEAICGDVARISILDLLTSLVQKSLVVAQRVERESSRYRLLDSMQAYAEQKLSESDELEPIRRRHYEYFRSALTSHIVYTWGPRAAEDSIDVSDEDWKARESANLWAAVTWARDNTEDMGLGLAYDMAESQHGDLPRITALLVDLVEKSHARGISQVKVLMRASSIAMKLGEWDRAMHLAERTLPLARELGNPEAIGKALSCLGGAHLGLDDFEAALRLEEEALAMLRGSGNLVAIRDARYGIAWAKLQLGEARAAVVDLTQLVDECRSSKGPSELGWYLVPLGWAQLGTGDHNAASASFIEAISICRTLNHHWDLVWCLEGMSALACAQSDDIRAVRLAGAAARTSRDWSLLTFSSRRLGKILETSRVRLGNQRSEEAWNVGWAMGVDRALDYAIVNQAIESPPDAGLLTRRERLVARLVAAGMSNRQIAKELFLAERTVEGHVERIRNKLDVHSRTDVAVWAVEHGLAVRKAEA